VYVTEKEEPKKWVKNFDGGSKISVIRNVELQLVKNLNEHYFESSNENVTMCIF